MLFCLTDADHLIALHRNARKFYGSYGSKYGLDVLEINQFSFILIKIIRKWRFLTKEMGIFCEVIMALLSEVLQMFFLEF